MWKDFAPSRDEVISGELCKTFFSPSLLLRRVLFKIPKLSINAPKKRARSVSHFTGYWIPKSHLISSRREQENNLSLLSVFATINITENATFWLIPIFSWCKKPGGTKKTLNKCNLPSTALLRTFSVHCSVDLAILYLRTAFSAFIFAAFIYPPLSKSAHPLMTGKMRPHSLGNSGAASIC